MKEGKSTFNSKQDDINSVNNKLNASKQVFSSIAHSDEWKVKGRRFSCTSAKYVLLYFKFSDSLKLFSIFFIIITKYVLRSENNI